MPSDDGVSKKTDLVDGRVQTLEVGFKAQNLVSGWDEAWLESFVMDRLKTEFRICLLIETDWQEFISEIETK